MRHAADGTVTELELGGIVLGAFEGIALEEQRLDLAPGDALILYTDGVTEALNGEGEMFGEERLREVISQPGQQRRPRRSTRSAVRWPC